MADNPISTAPRDGSLIEVKFPDGEWDRVRWVAPDNWRREVDGHIRINGGGCMPGEWGRIGRWRPATN